MPGNDWLSLTRCLPGERERKNKISLADEREQGRGRTCSVGLTLKENGRSRRACGEQAACCLCQKGRAIVMQGSAHEVQVRLLEHFTGLGGTGHKVAKHSPGS